LTDPAVAADQAMRDYFLYAAAALGLFAAIVHSWLGEARIFPRVRIDPARLTLLMRLVWHAASMGWAGLAFLLIAAPSISSPVARYWIIGAGAAVYAFAAIGNGIATRWRHYGWIVLALAAGFALAGL
jgi:hypothetical protein